MPEKIIQIQCQGPFTLSYVKSHFDKDIDYGLYQVNGSHPIYGKDTLLYFGKACQQTFAKRIPQENWEGWAFGQENIEIHIGRLAGSTTPVESEWEQQIDLAEKLMIIAHKPAHNASGVSSLSGRVDKAVRKLHILNWGDFGVLIPEVSGARWSDEYDDPPNYKFYGEH